MKKVIIMLYLVLFIFTYGFSQPSTSNKIETNENYIPQDTLYIFSKITHIKGISFEYREKKVKINELKYVLWINDESKKLYKKGKLYRIFGLTLGAGGILGTAYMIDALTYDYNVNMITPAIITGAMYIGGIVLVGSSKRKFKNSVDVYNNGIPYLSNNVAFNMGVTRHGVGLTITF